MWAYSAGWPPAFLGDLHYYFVDHDLTDEAAAIDTARVPGPPPHRRVRLPGTAGARAARPRRRSPARRSRSMDGVGHFPMAEDPDAFIAAACCPSWMTIRRNRP